MFKCIIRAGTVSIVNDDTPHSIGVKKYPAVNDHESEEAFG